MLDTYLIPIGIFAYTGVPTVMIVRSQQIQLLQLSRGCQYPYGLVPNGTRIPWVYCIFLCQQGEGKNCTTFPLLTIQPVIPTRTYTQKSLSFCTESNRSQDIYVNTQLQLQCCIYSLQLVHFKNPCLDEEDLFFLIFPNFPSSHTTNKFHKKQKPCSATSITYVFFF